MAIAVWAGAATVSAAWAAGPEMPGAVARTGEPPPGPVREPYWGTVLFEVYQDNTFSALTGLMAWQHFQRLPQHAEEAEVLRGGLLLDYGLDAEAGRIFTSVINRQTTARTRDRAWFYLARLQFRKGLMAEAQTSITQSGPALPAELQDERLLLRAQLQLAQADHLGAAQTLQSMPAGSPLRPYAQFNLGVALLQAGQAAAGRQALQALGQLPAEGEELRSLRDRANLALGFDALREGDAKSAHGALERVRLAGPQSNAALLGFGWAALQRADTRLALAAFRELAQRPAQDAAVLESQLAQAHVTAQAGAPAAALSLYQAALKAYQAEHTALDAAIARTRGGDWLDALGGGQTPGRMGAAAKLNIQPQTPYAAYLTPMLAEHAVQQALRNWGDLRFAAARLSEWAQQLTVHEEMLAERASTFASRLPNVLAGADRKSVV